MNMRAAFLLIVPLFFPPAAGLLYTHLNIHRRLFVDWLGCGCKEGFNTNWLSLIVCLLVCYVTGSACWSGSRGLPARWRRIYLVSCGLALMVFFGQFIRYNMWA
jgi:hypothetical protein